MDNNGQFLVAVSALIINDQHEVLITQRSYEREHHPGEWETQAGRLQQGESVIDALIREMQEELNILVEPILPINTFHFYRGTEKIEHIGITYLARIKSGQIKVDGKEEIAFRWVTIQDALNIIKDDSILRDIKILEELLKKDILK